MRRITFNEFIELADKKFRLPRECVMVNRHTGQERPESVKKLIRGTGEHPSAVEIDDDEAPPVIMVDIHYENAFARMWLHRMQERACR